MNKKILVVDDNRMSLEITRQSLEKAGYDVITEQSGGKGIEIIKKIKIDLIILDLIMPGLDGFGFLTICKSDPATQSIPVIVLTARDSQQEIEEVKAMGALDCFIKYRMPPAKLRERIKLILGD
ncbi:MAG: response regulator [Candidatus Omnitrophota bacterium]